jgi:epoxyqueuosine reductase|tara:strand:+ start:2734 stop:3720 length:987 start_codon:yes stop_codon:yes gene_type:complete
MAKLNPYRPFIPNSEMVVRLPTVTGNTINGLGETEQRRPKLVFWAPNPDDIAFGEVQKWFYMCQPDSPEMATERAKRQVVLDAALPDLNPLALEQSPSAWTSSLDQFVDAGDCEMVGATEMKQEWVFEGQETTFKTVIMVGVHHDYEELKHAPEFRAGIEVVRQYGRAAAAAKKITAWLMDQGWDAEAVTGPMAGKLVMIPPALECGFGELGKHGSLINPEFGSSFRLSAVLTNAPFASTKKRDFGIDEFCSKCRICEDACPPIAIEPDKKTVRGDERWYVDFDKCIPYFAENSGCAICIVECPWSRPGVGIDLAQKLARRSARNERK